MSIRSFTTIEDLFATLEADEAAARKAMETHPVKMEDLRDGDIFVSVRGDLGGVIIYGRVIEAPEDDEDYAAAVENRSRGYVFGKCFSEMCPDGEVGDTHITRINGKISAPVFERLRVNGFRNARETN